MFFVIVKQLLDIFFCIINLNDCLSMCSERKQTHKCNVIQSDRMLPLQISEHQFPVSLLMSTEKPTVTHQPIYCIPTVYLYLLS